MRTYIAGPMTGRPDFNRPAFYAAEDTLRALGHDPINPADVQLADDASWLDYMRQTMRLLTEADAVCVLPGWTVSRGAQIEVYWANSVGIPIKTLNQWKEEAS
jgi:hypothetical protein